MSANKTYDFQNGEILLINKALTWTSFDVVNFIKKFLRATQGERIKVGHAGTLDPLASGLLIVCTGRATKKINTFMNMDKEYTGTFCLGASTPSYDAESEIDQRYETGHITQELIHQATNQFKGKIIQTPPLFSAVKIDGKPAYLYARKNKEVKIKPREVTISAFEITRIGMPEVDFRISCSKGTYIRSLASDFGKSLDSGAYLTALCRTRIGEFRLEDAMTIEQFRNSVKNV